MIFPFKIINVPVGNVITTPLAPTQSFENTNMNTPAILTYPRLTSFFNKEKDLEEFKNLQIMKRNIVKSTMQNFRRQEQQGGRETKNDVIFGERPQTPFHLLRNNMVERIAGSFEPCTSCAGKK